MYVFVYLCEGERECKACTFMIVYCNKCICMSVCITAEVLTKAENALVYGNTLFIMN